MPVTDWAGAYARQAAADWATHERLWPEAAVPDCHKLMFLQMACEKLAKAHLRRFGADPAALQSSHAYAAKTLPVIVRLQLRRPGTRVRNAPWVLAMVRRLAREIELLAPAVDDGGGRPDNCEYPWADARGRLHVPAEWTFPTVALLAAPAGRVFLKLMRTAIADLNA